LATPGCHLETSEFALELHRIAGQLPPAGITQHLAIAIALDQ